MNENRTPHYYSTMQVSARDDACSLLLEAKKWIKEVAYDYDMCDYDDQRQDIQDYTVETVHQIRDELNYLVAELFDSIGINL